MFGLHLHAYVLNQPFEKQTSKFKFKMAAILVCFGMVSCSDTKPFNISTTFDHSSLEHGHAKEKVEIFDF